MEPDRALRYKARTQGNRFFDRLEDEFGVRMIFVRGKRNLMVDLAYGVMAILADKLLESIS